MEINNKVVQNVFNMLFARNEDMKLNNGKSKINNTTWCRIYRVGNFKTQFLPEKVLTEEELKKVADMLLLIDKYDKRVRDLKKGLMKHRNEKKTCKQD